MTLLIKVFRASELADILKMDINCHFFTRCTLKEGQQYASWNNGHTKWVERDDISGFIMQNYKIVCYREWKRIMETQYGTN